MSVKEYCKKFGITDAAVRKNKNLNTVIHNDLTYVVVESDELEALKNKVKLLNANIKALRNKIQIDIDKTQYIEELKKEKQELKDRVKFLEARLDGQVEQKEKLYEKVIGHMIEHKA
jgi:seryl-tRNA synthetase